MSPRALLAGFALAALVVGVSQSLKGDETPPVAGDVQLDLEKVAALNDGGTGYVREYKAADGGVVQRIVQPACVRRLADAGPTTCRFVQRDGGLKSMTALVRFPADASVGAKCQLVACSVWQGEDSTADETLIVGKQRDGGGGK